MKIFASQSLAYRAGLLLLLLCLTVVFVDVARWRMAQYAPPSPYGPYPSRIAPRPAPPTEPAARVEAGRSVQGPFTLLGVSRTGQSPTSQLPPGIETDDSLQLAYRVDQRGEGTGLFVDIQGGVGIQTRTVPVDGARHVLAFGPDTSFVATLTPTPLVPVQVTWMMILTHYLLGRPLPSPGGGGGWTGSAGWFEQDGTTPLPDDRQPFTAEVSLQDTGRRTRSATYVFVPRRLSALFPIHAQPLTASGAPLAGPVSLECQPVNAHVLFARLPAAYSDRTRRMEVTITRASDPAGRAAWRLSDLPAAHRNGPDVRPAHTAAVFGALSIQAGAWESEDLSGTSDWSGRHPTVPGGAPPNVDGHPWTGVPTLGYRLRLRNGSPPAARQEWTVGTERITPQWTVPAPPAPSASGSVAEGRVEAGGSYPVGGPWQDRGGQVGIAYPGQQRWLQLDGVATRIGYRFESVTLRDADIAFDPAAGHWRVSWRRVQTASTSSGVSVTTLNARPGPPRTTAPRWSGLRFSPDGDTAEMFLAWRLPPGLTGSGVTQDNIPRQAYPPGLFGAVVSDFETNGPPPDWHDVWVPGAALPAPIRSASGRLVPAPTTTTALEPLIHEGWVPLRYALRLPETPPALTYSSSSGGLGGRPLPAHLDSLTFRVYFRAPLERHPFTLVLPVAAQPPAIETASPPRPLGTIAP